MATWSDAQQGFPEFLQQQGRALQDREPSTSVNGKRLGNISSPHLSPSIWTEGPGRVATGSWVEMGFGFSQTPSRPCSPTEPGLDKVLGGKQLNELTLASEKGCSQQSVR